MHKKKSQNPTTNPVAQKQEDTSKTKKLNLNLVQPTPQKEDDKTQTRNITQFMAKKNTEYLDALVFIDTNILLDFYRIRKSNISMKYLEEIERHKELIIITSQVEMEFKKNRQSAILESIGEVKKFNVPGLSVPTILSDTKAVELINNYKKGIIAQQKKLKEKIEKILKNPLQDPVYRCLDKVFKHKSKINLDRDSQIRFTVRNLAKKRFILGYPPRKRDDNSIGDAINWEWIIKCAQMTGKNIILVTRDTDFGAIDETDSYLNDWLKQEFKQRVGARRKFVLTDKLSKAFQLLQIPVSKEMIEEEQKVSNYINKGNAINFGEYQDIMIKIKKMFEVENNFSNFQKIKFYNPEDIDKE